MHNHLSGVTVFADSSHNWGSLDEARSFIGESNFVMSLGDLTDIEALTLSSLNVPVFGVYGNHDDIEYMSEYPNFYNLIDDRNLPARLVDIKFNGNCVRVMAVQGCVRYKSGTDDVLFTQDQYAETIANLGTASWVVTHCPPTGCNDDPKGSSHEGIDALAKWCEKHRPSRIFHGHTHPDPGKVLTHYKGADVHYVFGADYIPLTS